MSNEQLPLTNRGFLTYSGREPIDTSYGHKLTVQESSSAEEHRVWLNIEDSDLTPFREVLETQARHSGRPSVGVHMNREQAIQLRDALNHFISTPTTRNFFADD